ncbi:hypothetical protein [Candidatus Methylospira mobilis]|nr:hypothetical protein [Candidatus Methylospira mobilis]
MYPKTHVILVSDPATPNLTPALDADLKPDENRFEQRKRVLKFYF